ncbi:uncharacterized protein TNCV_3180001 [Trichonephila clavipes]|nr:uncharacterized protein TNCV_3180001 [Trichonephila clavipes]
MLADGAKQSFSLRGKNRLRIFTLRLTDGAHRYHCSRRKQKPTSDINKALTGGAQKTSLNQSPGDQSRGFSTADSHWLGTRACAVLAISLRCQSMFRYFTARLEILTLKLGEGEVLLQGCGIGFQETGNVRRRPGAGRPRATTSTDDRYISPSKQNRECYPAAKIVALGNRTKGVQPNST